MNLRIRRRRFGQLALASAATAAIANLGTKAVAQSPANLFGIRFSSGSGPRTIEDVSSVTNVVNTTPELTLFSTNVATGSTIATLPIPTTTVSNQNAPINLTPTLTPVESIEERLTSLTNQSDGILVSTVVSSTDDGVATRLVFTNPNSSQSPTSVRLSGFPNNNSTVESLVATRANSLIGLISTNASVLPFELATIDRTTGNVISGASSGLPRLDPTRGYGTLAQSPDGTIYIVTTGREGTATLAQFNVGSGISTTVPLTFNNKPLGNGLLSLTISPSGEFYALANPNYQEVNSLFTLDPRTGVLTLVRQFDADQITFTAL
ncbi:hypothetical protein [Iningainema tapete]|uniref:Uncharacterized protein n=1 Tax=Iningainema tapete BLCC-T55 TaxID=2748662 RepID=A0A8J7CDN8_9CYAN|nr:hypothetical protein [Iningainema tapete]MBD2772980.1 hypothetical protein [Iningainema tapete BLCC-T55]